MKPARFFIALFILLIDFSLSAETYNISAENAVTLAVESNLNLKITTIETETKRRDKDTAWNVFIPSINGSVDLGHSRTFLSDPSPNPLYPDAYDPSWNMKAGLSLNLPLNAAAATGIRQTIIDYQESMLGYEDAVKKLSRDVRKLFYNLLAMESNIELKRFNIEVAEKRYIQARENYSNGLISELDMLQAQVSVENEKPALNNLLTQYENSKMSLKMLLGLPLNAEIILEGNLDDLTYYSLDAQKLIDSYTAGRMDLIRLDKQIESIRNTRKLQSEYNRTPTLSLYSNWGTSVDEPMDSENWKEGTWIDNLTMGVQIGIPLDGFIPSSTTAVTLKTFDDQIENLLLQKEALYDQAAMEITSLVMSLENSMNTIDTYGLNEELARKSFELTTEAYNLGTRELLDVETAQESYLSASLNILREKTNYINNLQDLQYAINADNLSDVLEER